MNDTQLLPTDVAACRALIEEQRRKISEQDHTLVEQARAITELHQKVQEQELTINELLQRAYRHRSERYREDPDQLKLDFGNTPEAADAADGLAAAVEEAEDPRQRAQASPPQAAEGPRRVVPRASPRYEVTLRAPPEVEHCAEHGERKLIGYDSPGDAGIRAAQAQGPRDADSQVRLRRPAGLRRERSRRGRRAWSRATATTPAWPPRSSPPSTATTCRSIASRTISPAAAGRPRGARS